jgi:lambda family phage portal protein
VAGARTWSAKRIRGELGRRGVTLAAIARNAGVSPTTVRRSIESGSPAPRVATALARSLGTKREAVWPKRFSTKASFGAPSGPTYEGSTYGRRLGLWGTSGIGPTAAIQGNIHTLRNRSRELYRNNAWARRGAQSYVSNAIGTGIVPRWTLDDQRLKRKIEKLWLRWTDESDADGLGDFYSQQATVALTQFLSGETLVRFRPRRLTDGLSVPLQLQVLEPDHLDEMKDGPLSNGNFVRMGIEFSRIGRRVAYWLRNQHPGEWFPMSGNADAWETVRVPASEVMHVYAIERPGQIRGIPRLSSVLLSLYELDRYEDAELVRKKLSALIGGYIIRPPTAAGAPPFGIPQGTDANDQEIAALEPGAFPVLPDGMDVRFSTPADVGGMYAEWMRQQLRRIAAGIGVTYEQLTGDLTQVNYSSIRAGLIEIRRSLEALQWNVFVFQLCRPVAARWMDTAVAAGALEIPDYAENRAAYLDIAWRPQRWPWVDPMKDIAGEKLAVDNLFKSRSQVIAEMGEDAVDVDEMIAEDDRRAAELGIAKADAGPAPVIESEDDEDRAPPGKDSPQRAAG